MTKVVTVVTRSYDVFYGKVIMYFSIARFHLKGEK